MEYKIGFMQGRLSPMQGKKIQSFPWKNWKNEFQIGRRLNFKIIEWTLDFKKLYSNPLMTKAGQRKIRALCLKYNLKILNKIDEMHTVLEFLIKQFLNCDNY